MGKTVMIMLELDPKANRIVELYKAIHGHRTKQDAIK